MHTDKIDWNNLGKERSVPITTLCECSKPIYAKGFCHACYNISLREHQKRKVVSYYSNGSMKCACCGESHIEFLTMEHKNGGGNKHRKEIGNNIYSWLIKNNFPEGFEVLCYNCNMCKYHHKECYHKNPEIKHISKYVYNRRYKVLSHYSPELKCACCGETIFYFLSMDHIDGGGTKHIKSLNGGNSRSFYFWLIRNNYPSGFRVLCYNCNCSLGRYNYCPHHPEGVPVPFIPKEEDTYNKVDESIFA